MPLPFHANTLQYAAYDKVFFSKQFIEMLMGVKDNSCDPNKHNQVDAIEKLPLLLKVKNGKTMNL